MLSAICVLKKNTTELLWIEKVEIPHAGDRATSFLADTSTDAR